MTTGERPRATGLVARLRDWWWWHGFSFCAECRWPFWTHAFWNADGPHGNRLTCSLECCAKAKGQTAAELLAELP